MKHAASTRKAQQKSSGRPKISESILDQNRSRLLMASALGVCSLAMTETGHAEPYCSSSSNSGYVWNICQANDGVNKNNERDGDTGRAMTLNNDSWTFSAGSSLPYTSQLYDQDGVMIARSHGGNGVEEGSGGAVAP